MAQASKKKRNERKQRRANNRQTMDILRNNFLLRQENGALKNAINRAQRQQFQSTLTLLGVLSQRGGELEVTAGTMQQVRDNLQKYDYEIVPKESDANTFVVRVVEADDRAAGSNFTSITPEEASLEPANGAETQVDDIVPEETAVDA